MTEGRVWQVALAGNVLVLWLGVLLLANSAVLFGPPPVPAPPPQAVPGPRAERLLLVVLDALRVDTAARVALMPRLHALARQGGRGQVRVTALIPATVAIIQILTTGQTPPPVAFFGDFGAATADHGGLFQVLQQTGGASFVAGTYLWQDLYGPWLAGAATVATFRDDDARTLAAALTALHEPCYRLVVVHFTRLDERAHRFGVRSAAYAGAAAGYDRALGQLLDALPPGMAVLVTADNGVTDQGGHAGPEPLVLTAPLVTFGPGLPTGELGTRVQNQLPRLVLNALGVAAALPVAQRDGFSRWLWLAVLPATVAALWLLAALADGWRAGWQGFVLSSALWLGLGVAVLGGPVLALGVFTLALVGVALRTASRSLQKRLPLLALGGGFALLWLYDGWQALGTLNGQRPPLLGDEWLWVVVVAGFLLGRALGRWQRPVLSGGLLALSPALLAALLGETVSLSTLAVGHAFAVVDSPFGVAGAVAVTVLRLAMPGLALAAGIAPALARLSAAQGGALLAALAVTLLGMGGVLALLLGFSGDHTVTALALGGLLRVLAMAVCLFPALALGLVFSRIRHPQGRQSRNTCC